MRVLHVADRLGERGGAWTFLLGVIRGLASHHDQRLVVGAVDGALESPCPLELRGGLELRTARPVALDDLAAWADVVHVHNVTNPAVIEWAAARGRALLSLQDHRFFCPGRGKWTLGGEACRRPLTRALCAACFEDGAYFDEVLSLTERRLRAARGLPLTVLSRYMREELIASAVPAGLVHVVPPFVSGLDTRAEASGPPCVLFLGRLVEAKGVREAVEAWRRSGVVLPLAIAGTGPLRQELEAVAARGGRPGIEVLGWVERRRLSALFRRAHAVVLPSRWQEPFGIAGLEALAFGVPVVAWESGGVSEWHRGPGLVPWGDVDALAGALAAAVNVRMPAAPGFERDETLRRLVALYSRL